MLVSSPPPHSQFPIIIPTEAEGSGCKRRYTNISVFDPEIAFFLGSFLRSTTYLSLFTFALFFSLPIPEKRLRKRLGKFHCVNRRSSLARTRSACLSRHCHIVITCQPRLRSWRAFRASRERLSFIFCSQYGRFEEGRRDSLQLGWPCQKQPCTKIAVLAECMTKSGLPGSDLTLRR